MFQSKEPQSHYQNTSYDSYGKPIMSRTHRESLASQQQSSGLKGECQQSSGLKGMFGGESGSGGYMTPSQSGQDLGQRVGGSQGYHESNPSSGISSAGLESGGKQSELFGSTEKGDYEEMTPGHASSQESPVGQSSFVQDTTPHEKPYMTTTSGNKPSAMSGGFNKFIGSVEQGFGKLVGSETLQTKGAIAKMQGTDQTQLAHEKKHLEHSGKSLGPTSMGTSSSAGRQPSMGTSSRTETDSSCGVGSSYGMQATRGIGNETSEASRMPHY